MTMRGPMLLGVALLGLALLGSFWFLSIRSARAPAAQPLGFDTSISARLPPGQVAVVLRPGLAAAAAGIIRPGDRVDVYAFLPAQGETAPVTRLLLRDTIVYGAAREADAQALTLGMPPEQALLIQHTAQLGARPFVTLRSSQAPGAAPPPEVFTDADLPSWLARQDAVATPARGQAGAGQ